MNPSSPMPDRPNSASRNYGIAQSLLLAVFAAAYLLDPAHPIFESRVAAGVGLGVCAAGLLLMFFALASLRAVVQVAPEPRAGGHLVTDGVYSRFRHPIYTAILVLVIGLFLRKPTLLVASGSLAVVIFLAVKVRFEEQLLVARYPDYIAYRQRSWGLVPWRGTRR
jgi:protein-S-isoprenylcysteine O-methyltransferase Ste14